jgi:hypothetical protein
MSQKHLVLVACALLLLAACKKEKNAEPDVDLDYTSATDNAKADDAFSDMMTQVDNAVVANGLRGMEDACDPVVTFDTLSDPHTVLIDFGTVNCTANNGRMRRGQLLASYTGHYRDPGTVITITPQNYYVNDNHVEGVKTITNMGEDQNGHLYYSIVANGTVTAADGTWTATHQANRTRTWIEGRDTEIRSDDVYLITGGGSGVNRRGVAYTSTILNALRVEADCAFITSGTVEVTKQDRPSRTIDYGNGDCDNIITVTVNGQTFTITIG